MTGAITKITKVIKTTSSKNRVNKAIADRRTWAKFGKCLGLPPGPEDATTDLDPDVNLVLTTMAGGAAAALKQKKQEKPQDTEAILAGGVKNVVCRHCGGNHWTMSCPYKHIPRETLMARRAQQAESGAADAGAAAAAAAAGTAPKDPKLSAKLAAALGKDVLINEMDAGELSGLLGSSSGAALAAASADSLPGMSRQAGDSSGAGPESGPGGAYVPPHLRRGARGREGSSMAPSRQDDRDQATVRITNLPPDIEEDELHHLFSQSGAIQRLYLARDRNTGNVKGFAFITYHRREAAALAVDKLHNYPFHHVILSVEWAKPRDD